jgi:glycosyltransferase involved in cell wall biosynthesis
VATISHFPKISIVTPSYNQGRYIEETICSILDQNYPNLEYIIMDGGSTDNSVEIIKKYEHYLKYWQSQKDRGQNHAITEGFKHATGDIYAYLNSDDKYLSWAFRTVAQIFTQFPRIQWLTSNTHLIWNGAGQPVQSYPAVHYARTWFYRGWATRLLGRRSGWIQQEATFWTPWLWQAAGARMDETLYLAGDFELWARFWQHADLVTTDIPLAGFRQHGKNKTTPAEYQQVCREILSHYPGQTLRDGRKLRLVQKLYKYTRRGANKWGSPANWVRYDQKKREWTYHSHYVI